MKTPIALAFLLAHGAASGATSVRTPQVLDVQDVYDSVVDRFDILYASSDAGVRRFDLRTGAELPPLQVPGANVRTLALDPSGCRLAISDVSGVNQGVWVLEDLSRSTPRKILFPMTTFHAGYGSYSVIWEGMEHLLSSSSSVGSGLAPVRRTAVGSGIVEDVLGAQQDVMLAAAANGQRWAMVEASTSGPLQLRDVATRTTLDQVGVGFLTHEVAVSRAGDIVTVPTYAGTFVFDVVDGRLVQRAARIGVYSDYGPIGMAFSPHTSASFAAVGGWDPPDRGVFMYPDYTFLSPLRLDPAQFTWNGNRALEFGRTRISADGRTLTVTHPHTVLVYDVAEWGADPDAVFSDGAECSAWR